MDPVDSSDNRFILKISSNVVWLGQTSLRFSEMPSPDQQIKFYFPNQFNGLSERRKLRAFLISLFKKERQPIDTVSYIFCSDEYLLKINQSFLQHDNYTDIITFVLSEPKSPVCADIYISTDRVKENSKSFGVSFRIELQRVVFHGALHICGYRDKTEVEIKKMRKKEDYYLKSYNS